MGTSALDAVAKQLVVSISNRIVPTVLDIAIIVVPVGIAVWAVGFGIKKGIGYLQFKANMALSEKAIDDYYDSFADANGALDD